ncbi:hypothetical protein SAMN05444157_0981 [Frankineae bacterium MT45]|nr:hypothetical protein SAMN05444157_0981 [Frankineae bacterium MT45]
MPADGDSELLEAIHTRRRRVEDSFLRGSPGSHGGIRRPWRQLLISLALAVVICLGCAAASYARRHGYDLTALATAGYTHRLVRP